MYISRLGGGQSKNAEISLPYRHVWQFVNRLATRKYLPTGCRNTFWLEAKLTNVNRVDTFPKPHSTAARTFAIATLNSCCSHILSPLKGIRSQGRGAYPPLPYTANCSPCTPVTACSCASTLLSANIDRSCRHLMNRPKQWHTSPFGQVMCWYFNPCLHLWPEYNSRWPVDGLQTGFSVPSMKPQMLLKVAPFCSTICANLLWSTQACETLSNFVWCFS